MHFSRQIHLKVKAREWNPATDKVDKYQLYLRTKEGERNSSIYHDVESSLT